MEIDDVRSRLPTFTAELEAGISAGLHTGGQAYISLHNQAIADFGFGYSEPNIPITSDTLMPWMSGSKPVAAVGIGQLYERGLLNLDDPVTRYIPEFAQNGKSAVTLTHILTHTGGFRGSGREQPGTPWDEIIRNVCALPLEPGWTPGITAGYHIASSWFILGEVIRRIDGRDYNVYVREQIFEPLDMRDSWIGMPFERFLEYDSRIGRSYFMERNSNPVLHPWHDAKTCTWCSPGGGGRGPMHDLGKFYLAMLNGGAGPHNSILSPETVKLLSTRRRIGQFDETFRHKIDWGLGFIVNSNQYGAQTVPYSFGQFASASTFGHGGFQSSCSMADPDHQLVIAVALNGTPGEARHSKRIRTLNSAIYRDLGLTADDSVSNPS